MVVACLALIAAMAWWLEDCYRSEVVARANALVALKVVEAQAQANRRQWKPALRLLHEALATDNATDKARARALLGDIELATSDARALALLKVISERAFNAFAKRGRLADLKLIGNDCLRTVYRETLRRNLPKAQAVRAADCRRREQERLARAAAQRQRRVQEQARRAARLCATPVYRELSEFIARARKQDKDHRTLLEDYDKKLVEASGFLLAGNQVNDPALQQELARVRREQAQEQKRIAGWRDQLEELISRIRANVKERIRTYRGFDDADWKAFDQLADRQLDALWGTIKNAEDEFAF
jgi:hypothetical protein